MPNWCTTYITINHESETELKKLEQKITEWMNKEYEKNGFGNGWLGNIVGNSGIGTVDTGNETDLRCRGCVGYMETIDSQLLIQTNTAWVPMLKMWIRLLEKYLPDAELIYSAEECGCDLYCTNDPTIEGNYCIDDIGANDIDSNYEATKDETVEALQRLLDTEERDIDVLFDKFNKSEYVASVFIHQWEYVDEYDWD